MSANITLQGKVYSNVPSVILPTSGGGTATFTLNGEGGANVIIPYKSATITLTTSGWSSSNLTQTVTVQGVTNSSNIFVTPAQTNYNEYMLYGIQCTSQGINSLTFTCSKIPSVAIIVNVMVISDDGSGTTISNNGIVTSISVDLIYPIGSIYTSINSTSPASLFGGTWAAIGTSGSTVIETGTSGIWTYRKWSDGTAECWGNTTTTPTDWQTWGTIYEAYPMVQINYPTNLFVATPTLLVNSDTQNGGTISLEVYANGSATKTPQVLVLRPNGGAAGTVYNIAFHAIGKWTTTASSINKFYSWKRTA